MSKLALALLAAAPFAFASAASASALGGKVETGSFGDMVWTAQSLIVGATPTAGPPPPRFSGPGDPIFHVGDPRRASVVPIIMFYEGVGAFICSSTLVGPRTLLTAAHCVSDGAGTPNPTTTTAWFQENLGPSDRPPTDGIATPITVASYAVNPLYTGEVIDHNDIAFLTLSADAPAWAVISEMDLDATSLRGVDFTVVGFGNRSIEGFNGPAGGATPGTTGFIREGDNLFDFRFGDPVFGGAWESVIGPASRIDFSYVSDVDNGLAANDTVCLTTQASNILGPGVTTFCDLGVGAREVSVAGGDSGGPQFVNGKIVSVTSYGLTFGVPFGDCRTGLQSSCGEFNGFAPLYYSRDWIRSVVGGGGVIPEPGTWAMLIAGFGLVGAMARRRRETAVTA